MGRLRALVVATAIATVTGLGLAPLATAPAGAAVDPTPAVDPSDRASVMAAYQASLVEARAVPVGWTGDAATCAVGTESAASIAATRAAVNYYRTLNRLAPVTMDAAKNRAALTGAVLMHANGTMSHTPPATWRCWSQAGADAAGSSNLSRGAVAARAIDIYMADPGPGNTVAGHRRWILDPTATTFGTGSTTVANALAVFGPTRSRPAGVTWVAWPNAGFVPKAVVAPLFSLSSNRYPDADYSSASVSVTVGGTALPVTVHTPRAGYGDSTLTWQIGLPADFATSAADVRFDIRVSGVRTRSGAVLPTHAYSSTAVATAAAPTVAATVPRAPTAVEVVGGTGQATVTWTAPATGGSPVTAYRVTPFVGAVAQTPRTVTGTATSATVTGLTAGTIYRFTVQAVNAVGPGPTSASSASVLPPFASWSHFVDQMHRQLVGRPASAAERTRWVGPLTAGTQAPVDLIASLRASGDHRTAVDPVARLYRASFQRTPDVGGLAFWAAQRRAGRSTVSIADFFARSAELTREYGTLTDRQLVERIYENVLGRPGEAAGVDFWTAELTAGRRTRGTVMLGFSESSEYRADQAAAVHVAALFILLLDRAPTTAQLAAGVATLDGGATVAVYARSLLTSLAVRA